MNTIEINGIKGDVIDIDSIYTTMMEIGEWVSSDNYSGRIVKLSNAFVFNWIRFNLRYIVDYKKRRYVKHLLNDLIGKEIEKTNQKVMLASATFEIVRIPAVEIEKSNS